MAPAEFRAARKRLGLTQVALAQRLGLRRETVSDYERGIFPVPRITGLLMERLAEDARLIKDGGS